MGGVFISYRRDDAAGYARAIYEELTERFSPDRVFMDVDAIEPGLAFDEVIRNAVGQCEVLLVLIGGRYVTSGKVYEYVATGLPIMSVHNKEHDASTVLQGYPFWADTDGLDAELLAGSFRALAGLASRRSVAGQQAARALAARFEAVFARAADRHAIAAAALDSASLLESAEDEIDRLFR